MNDTDLMPFGEYQGKRMIDIPASYFLYLEKQGNISDPEVKLYIEDNMDVFLEEVKRERNLYEKNNKYYNNRSN